MILHVITSQQISSNERLRNDAGLFCFVPENAGSTRGASSFWRKASDIEYPLFTIKSTNKPKQIHYANIYTTIKSRVTGFIVFAFDREPIFS